MFNCGHFENKDQVTVVRKESHRWMFHKALTKDDKTPARDISSMLQHV